MVSVQKSDIEWIENIPLSQFSNKAVILSGRFVRQLRKNGREIQLNDPQLTKALVSEVCNNDDPKVHEIFAKLKVEFELIAKQNGIITTSRSPELTKESTNLYRGGISKVPNNALDNSAMNNGTGTNQMPKKQKMYRGIPID